MGENKPIKVLHVVGAMNRAGTETMLMNIYRNIDRRKVQFDFISYSNEEAHYDKEIKELGGKIIQIESTTSLKELKTAIKENGPYKVVHAHTLFNSGIAMLAAKMCNIPVRISHAHTTFYSNDNLVKKIYSNAMRFLINKNSTNLLGCSKSAGEYLFGSRKVEESKYQYFQNLIDYKCLLEHPQKEIELLKKELDIKNEIVIGHIGTLKESKNHKFLLEVVRYMKENNISVKLLIVGDGEQRKNLEEIALKYGIKEDVKFLGTREDINILLHSMDVFVFPSIYEGLGLVLLEAQATGLPCLVSEAIQPEADLGLGLFNKLTLNDSIERWSEKILQLSNDKESSIEKIEDAFHNKGYSTDSCIEKLTNIYI